LLFHLQQKEREERLNADVCNHLQVRYGTHCTLQCRVNYFRRYRVLFAHCLPTLCVEVIPVGRPLYKYTYQLLTQESVIVFRSF
jgi:hypothetical protein